MACILIPKGPKALTSIYVAKASTRVMYLYGQEKYVKTKWLMAVKHVLSPLGTQECRCKVKGIPFTRLYWRETDKETRDNGRIN